MPECNQVKWRGVRQAGPREPFHVQNRPAIGDEYLINACANNQDVIILTVPTGHTYYLTAMSLMFLSSGNGYCYSNIKDTTPTDIFFGGAGEKTTYGEYCINNNMIAPITLLEGYTVHVVSSSTYIDAYLSLQYFDDTP